MHGVEKKLALGRYPEMTVSEARKARDAAREAASTGEDPSATKRRERIAARIAIGTTFGDVAQEYIDKAARESRAPATLLKLEGEDQALPELSLRADESERTKSNNLIAPKRTPAAAPKPTLTTVPRAKPMPVPASVRAATAIASSPRPIRPTSGSSATTSATSGRRRAGTRPPSAGSRKRSRALRRPPAGASSSASTASRSWRSSASWPRRKACARGSG
ncbi:Arm DNA-binding domain-containing protein [Rubellimicrobium roseum]|uniref:Arm DNA-binding domain-containing protein n=1 Tax=Rubellimicrobium roseum TaxID=687525 RepID=UPI003CCC69D5